MAPHRAARVDYAAVTSVSLLALARVRFGAVITHVSVTAAIAIAL